MIRSKKKRNYSHFSVSWWWVSPQAKYFRNIIKKEYFANYFNLSFCFFANMDSSPILIFYLMYKMSQTIFIKSYQSNCVQRRKGRVQDIWHPLYPLSRRDMVRPSVCHICLNALYSHLETMFSQRKGNRMGIYVKNDKVNIWNNYNQIEFTTSIFHFQALMSITQ